MSPKCTDYDPAMHCVTLGLLISSLALCLTAIVLQLRLFNSALFKSGEFLWKFPRGLLTTSEVNRYLDKVKLNAGQEIDPKE